MDNYLVHDGTYITFYVQSGNFGIKSHDLNY